VPADDSEEVVVIWLLEEIERNESGPDREDSAEEQEATEEVVSEVAEIEAKLDELAEMWSEGRSEGPSG
jgi:hypothetical protein